MAGSDQGGVVREAALAAAPAFHARDWRWCDVEGRPPSVAELEHAIWRLVNRVAENGLAGCATGRFRVTAEDDGDLRICLDLGYLEGYLAASDEERP